MFRTGITTTAALAAVTALVTANDGFVGVTSTGLQFEKTTAIAMEREDLFIGLNEIKVDYVFRNTTKADVTGIIAFPMPAIQLRSLEVSAARFAATDLDKPNPLDFTSSVDGRPVAVMTDRRAYLEPSSGSPGTPPLSRRAEYDAPGADVTDYLTSLGIPIAFDLTKIFAALDKLSASQRMALDTRGLASKEDDPALRWFLGWSIVVRHHWTQTFPAGATVRISHRYRALPEGGSFGASDVTSTDYRARYCIDEGTGRAIDAMLPGNRGGTAFNIGYILTTANTWKGPIGYFRLTLDKGAPANVLSLCMDGIRKISPTRFEVVKANFTPTRDLEILVVSRDSPTLK